MLFNSPANNILHSYIENKNKRDSESHNDKLDHVLILKFQAPHSFTGEDIVEIDCHGGPFIIQKILSLLLTNGARLAEPGEFTRRAFLNGKLDLLQAEAVADIINAQTQKSLSISFSQLQGMLSERLQSFKKKLKNQCTLLELELDFSEEEVEFADRKELYGNLKELQGEIQKLVKSFKYGKIIKDGIHAVILGKPNVGKSSILNRLLEEERAIVSEIPGTTRDSLEESIDIDGLLFKITDTAGLRETSDIIEREGVFRTEKLVKNADLLILVLDASTSLSDEDYAIINKIENDNNYANKNIIIAANKSDIGTNKEIEKIAEKVSTNSLVLISAKTGDGFGKMEEKMVAMSLEKDVQKDSVFISKERHKNALEQAHVYLENAVASMDKKMSSEFIALDLRSALDCLGEITGEVTREEILNDIFSHFCIGK